MTPRSWLRAALALTTIGWGANQFAAMLLVYRRIDGLSDSSVTLMFAAYVIGLMPALLGAAWLSAHHGQRPIIRTALVLATVGTVLLIIGSEQTWALYAGRVVAGVATGAAMGPGTAWMKELSAGEPLGTGARRATIALSSGFGGGPLIAGAVAQLAPAPQVTPYLVHLVAMAVAVVLAWTTPEPARTDHATPSAGAVARSLAHPWFLIRVAPAAAWVFGSVVISFIFLPSRLADGLAGAPYLLTGVIAGATLLTGVLVQGPVRRFEDARPGHSITLGLSLLLTGLALGMGALALDTAWFLFLTAPVLGAAYGTLMVAGLCEVERHMPRSQLAPGAAVYYCLTYLGFFVPWVLSLFGSTPGWALLSVCWMVAAVGLVVVRPRSGRTADA
ncbi:MAG: MFS transporter [Propionibacteriaceae bacterium]|nr:MFS transporter [Propionibacteriaceae bacterium]